MTRYEPANILSWCGKPSFALVSFDVFDTVLTRPVIAPGDLFTSIGRRAARRLGRACQPGDAETFAACRLQAESLARKATSSEETSLEAIWAILEELTGWPGLRAVAECELEAERDALVPVRGITAAVAHCRGLNKQVAFVSDTYLPETFVREQLLRQGILQAGDGLYVSSAFGHTKASGALFRDLLNATGIPPHRVAHMGDHPVSDVKVPRSLGIACRHVTASACSADEWDLYRRLEPRNECASRIAGAAKAFRASAPPGADADEAALVGQLLGPVIMVFVAWAFAEARRLGLKRLYFCSRDGYLPWRMASRLAPRFASVECRYLHVSRRSLYLPSVFRVAPEEMPWLRKWFERNTLRQTLPKLDLSLDEFAPLSDDAARLARHPDAILNDSAWNTLWKVLEEQASCRLILDKAATARDAALGYFRQQGLCDDSAWAIVDIGWHLSCQSALRKLLRAADPAVEVCGLYLGLRDERAPPCVAGPAYAMCYGPGQPVWRRDRAGPLFGLATVWEHLFGCAPHGNVRRYVSRGDRRVAEPDCVPESHPRAAAMATLVDAYTEANAELAELLVSGRHLDELAIGVLSKAATNPSLDVARVSRSWSSSRDEAGVACDSLARPYGLLEAVAASFPSVFTKLGLPVVNREWPAASRRLSSWPVQGVFTCLQSLKRCIRDDN